jgi:excisionase family DNA binding protein
MSVNAESGIRLLTVPEVAERLNLSEAKVWRLISSGRLKAVKIDWSRRVRSDHLDEYIKALATEHAEDQVAS